MNKSERKLLVCDVEGTIFKAEYKIPGTDFSSTMWQPLAQKLDEYNCKIGKKEKRTTVDDEKESNIEWEKREKGKYKGKYIMWVNDTVEIHRKHGMNKKVFEDVLNGAEFNTGVIDFFTKLDLERYIPVFISGGFQELIDKAQRELINHTNEFCVKHGFAACEYIWDSNDQLKAWNIHPSDFKNKYAYLKLILDEYGLNETSDWIFVGDGKNDADIASRAPLSFAINPHPELAAVATYTIDSFNDIPQILNADETARNVSKKRGLSNRQSVTVGQRLLNANEIELVDFNENFKCDNGKIKFKLIAEISKSGHENLFSDVVYSIIDWAQVYVDDKTKYHENFTKQSGLKNYNFISNGTATVRCAYNENSKDDKSWGLFISAPDVGTDLRQAVLGANIEIHILLVNKSKDTVALRLYIVTKVPDISYIKKHNINLESYCPQFISKLCEEGAKIMIDGNKRLSKCFEKADMQKMDTIVKSKRSIPVVFINEEYCDLSKSDNLQKILIYTFGFAKIYKTKRNDINDLCETSDTAIAVFFPGGSRKLYNESYIDKPSDAISYDYKLNTRKLYSKGEEYEAVAINVSDYIIDNYKEMLLKEEWDDKNFYEEVLIKVSDNEFNKKLIDGKKVTAEELVNKSKTLEFAIENIEFVEKDAKTALFKNGIIDVQIKACLSGVRDFLEKGELILFALSEMVGTNELYPLSVIQPIACAFEICVNLLLFRKSGNDYFDIKKDRKEAGAILIVLESKKALTSYQFSILKKAIKIRNDSAHPKPVKYSLDVIIREQKNDIYEAIKLIEKII